MASGGDDHEYRRLLDSLPSDESGDLLFSLEDLSEVELLSTLQKETKQFIENYNELDFDTMKEKWENPFVENLNNFNNILDQLKSNTITDRNQKLDLIIKASILLDTFNETNERLRADGIDPSFFGYAYNKFFYEREYKFLTQLFETMTNPHKGGKRKKSRKSKKRKSKKSKRRRKSMRR
jgi:hypothetical protein